MGSAQHTGARRRSGRVRALLAVGMVVGIAQIPTLAAWNDQATVESGTFATGTLDLLVGESAADQLAGAGGVWQHGTLALENMAPGESIAAAVTVGNGGSMPFDYTFTVAGATGALTSDDGNGLRVTVTSGGTPSNSGSLENADRRGLCADGAATGVTDAAVSTSALAIESTPPVALAAGATKTYCVAVTLPGAAPNALQGAAESLTFSLEAQQ